MDFDVEFHPISILVPILRVILRQSSIVTYFLCQNKHSHVITYTIIISNGKFQDKSFDQNSFKMPGNPIIEGIVESQYWNESEQVLVLITSRFWRI